MCAAPAPDVCQRERDERRISKTVMQEELAEDRHYAPDARNASEHAVRTVPGTNRLTALGLTLLPMAPSTGPLGATRVRREDGCVQITWAMWTASLGVGKFMSFTPASWAATQRPAHA